MNEPSLTWFGINKFLISRFADLQGLTLKQFLKHLPHLPHGKVDNAVFIHGNLDDLGLPPHPFRVYCHVARRGQCFASVATIAKTCRMNPDTVRKALKSLVQEGLLTAQYRKGETTLYAVNHSKIINEPLPKGGSTPSRKNGVPPSINKVAPPPKRREATPMKRGEAKYIPLKISL